jgi:MipA family protein
MRPPRAKLRCLALALRLTVASGAQAWAQDGEGEFGLGLGLGAGGVVAETPYGFTTYSALPMIDYDSTYFRVRGPAADLKLPWISSDQLSFALRASIGVGEGYDAGDADILRGMADRDGGLFWAGAAMEWHTDIADISLEGLADVAGDSDGLRLQLEASHMFFLGEQVSLVPRIAATLMDENMVDFFYGVRPGEATAARPAFRGSSTVNFGAGVSVGYAPWENHMLMLDLGVTHLGDGITDSPIVVDDTLGTILGGYVFRF